MSEKEKPLPQPPATPFGLKKRFDQTGDGSPLVAGRLEMAMAEGKIDEYLEKEMPDNEQARKLAVMMMGMTGMADIAQTRNKTAVERPGEDSTEPLPEPKGPLQPPEDLVKAAVDGDVKGLMDILRREHEKNNPGAAVPVPAGHGTAPVIEKETVDTLAAIAEENSLTMDWLILRALKLYVQEYKKTGKL